MIRLFRAIRHWWLHYDQIRMERYLSKARDTADLERRMKNISYGLRTRSYF